MKNNRDYFIVEFILENQSFYTIWYNDKLDGFLTFQNKSFRNKIMTFYNQNSLLQYLTRNQMKLATHRVTVINCDMVQLYKTNFDCNLLLDFWNIITDVACSIKVDFLGDHREDSITNIYNKLFYGCNLPALRGNGELYFPEWSVSEIAILHEIVSNGLMILQKAF
ncbi:MAG: hypothetical protein IJX07_04545 [Bacillales bacterium]|nr:hypothetical protein [Bacillales bacterium]